MELVRSRARSSKHWRSHEQTLAGAGQAGAPSCRLWSRSRCPGSDRPPRASGSRTASEATLRSRVGERAARAIDASEADLRVLDHQLQMPGPLDRDEQASVVA